MGFGIFKKIKNGNKAVAGRLKKKLYTEAPPAIPKKATIEPTIKLRDVPKIKTRDDYPGLRFK